MSSIQSTLGAIGAFYAVIQGLLLLLSPNTKLASKVLGVWCVLLSLSFASMTVVLQINDEITVRLVGLTSFLPASFGALLYLYCRNLLQPDVASWRDIWHLFPLVLVYGLNLNIITAPSGQVFDYLINTPPQSTLFRLSQWVLFAQAISYIFSSYCYVNRQQNLAASSLANFNPLMFRWLFGIIAINLLIWSLKSLPSLGISQPFFKYLSDLMILLFITAIALAQWHDPRLFSLPKVSAVSAKQQKSSNSNLDLASQRALARYLEQRMNNEQLFRDTELSLRGLSDTLGCTVHQLSEVLNQQLGMNFYDYVNRLRVAYFQKTLAQAPAKTIIELSLDAGFANKSTFNVAFKKYLGTTPSQYRKSLSQQQKTSH